MLTSLGHHDLRRRLSERGDVLAGTAAELEGVSGLSLQEGRQNRPDRGVIAMEGRGVEPSVGFRRLADIAKFNHVGRHDLYPERRTSR